MYKCVFIELQINTMSGDLDLSPPEVPEPTFFESVLRYGLFLGAIFQLVCILAIIIPTSKSHEQVTHTDQCSDTVSVCLLLNISGFRLQRKVKAKRTE